MGLAMLAVMFYHAGYLELGLLNGPRALAFGGVDIFVLLSGLGLSMSLTRRKQEYGGFLVRRMKRVLPAYFAVMVPYTLYLLISHRASISTFFWNATLLQYWVRPAGQFNWYMTGIMIYVFFRIPVLLEGILLGLWVCGERKFTRRDGLCWLAVFLGGVGALALFATGVTEWATYAFAYTTVPVCLVVAWLLDRLPLSLVKRALSFLGENSLEIYLLNVSLFSEHALLRRFFDPDPGHYIYFAASLSLNILLGCSLHKLIARLVKGRALRR